MVPEPTQSELDIIARIYKLGARELAALLRSTDFQRGKASILLRQVDDISTRMGAASDHWVTGTMQKKILANARALDKEIAPVAVRIAGKQWPVIREGFLTINQGAVRVFSRQLARDLADKNLQIANTARRLISQTSHRVVADPTLSETIARGLVSGGNLNDISKSVRSRLADGGRELLDSGKYSPAELKKICDFEGGWIQAGQMRMKLDEYCRLVAHYQIRQAVTQDTKDRLGELGEQFDDPELFDLVQVVGPKGTACEICSEYAGEVLSLSGESKKYPAIADIPSQGPPFHPHCRHNLAPWIEGLSKK